MSFRTFLVSVTFATSIVVSPPLHADEEMRKAAEDYYSGEMTSSFLFVGVGALHAGVGVYSLTRDGDFAKSFGWSSVILGALTAIGGGGYGFTVAPRAKHFEELAAKDPVKYRSEELEHIQGTNDRFALYLGFEITETIVGAGVATYGFAKDKDVVKGIGLATAIQGVSLLALDIPGALRAQSYRNLVRDRFGAKVSAKATLRPRVGVVPGSGREPWLLSVAGSF